MIEQKFNSERILIGQGREANVYLWNGFAYKCFNSDYPKDLIDYEFKIQNTIHYSTGLSTIEYYESEIPHSIKMDFIDGIDIGKKLLNRSYKDDLSKNSGLGENITQDIKKNIENAFDIMLSLFSEVHSISENDIQAAEKKFFCEGNRANVMNNFNIPYLNTSLLKVINNLNLDNSIKQLAIRFISDIKDEKLLCHMDYHFFNIMYSYLNDKYYIIDWMDARLGNPIYDYARTYVILYEFANEISKIFLDLIKSQQKFDEQDFKKAIYVMSVHRVSESDSSKIKELINNYK